MPGLIYYDELKKALGLPPKAKQSTVERAMIKLGYPYCHGVNGVFTTIDAINGKVLGTGNTKLEINVTELDFNRD